MSRKKYSQRKNTKRSEEPQTMNPVSGENTTGETNNPSENKSTSNMVPTASNDPDWYSRDARLVEDGARIPFSTPFGAKLDLMRRNQNLLRSDFITGGTDTNRSVPGICSLVIKPSFGISLDKTSPLNVCANALYTHVRYVNSGRKNYDPADLFMYAAAFGDIYSFLCWCIRLYHLAFMYSQRNYYIGKDLIRANGVAPDDIIANLANYRYWINSIINKISSFCLPGDIYYFKRRVFLFSNYYVENDVSNIKDQLYQMVPDGFYAFALDENGAGKLEYKGFGINRSTLGTLLTINDIQNYFENTLMANITGDEDFGLMSGDVLKAYGDNIIKIAQISEEGGLLPVHDPYVLAQFKNAHSIEVYRRTVQDTSFTKKFERVAGEEYITGDLSQSTTGLLVSGETYEWTTTQFAGYAQCAWFGSHGKLISVESADPGVGDVLEATRLTPALYENPDASANRGTLIDCGTELVMTIQIISSPYGVVTEGAQLMASSTCALNRCIDPDTTTTIPVSDNALIFITQFKYMPIWYCLAYSNDDPHVLKDWYPITNLDNTTTVTDEILRRLHEIAKLSLFYVPGVAKLIS